MQQKQLIKAMSKWLGLGTFIIQAAHAGNTITVDSVGDQSEAGLTTLREAIDLANTTSNTEIVFDDSVFSTSQTITLEQGELLISSAVTIVGPGSDLLTISGNNDTRIIRIDDGTSDEVNVTINQLTLTAGNGISEADNRRGGCVLSLENLTMNQSVISQCRVAGSGGAIWALGGELTLNDSSVLNNTANLKGGGLYVRNSITEINQSTIAANQSSNSQGGGIFIEQQSVVAINNSTISNNFASRGGDGIHLNSGNSTLDLSHATVFQNNKNGIDASDSISMSNSVVAGHSQNDCVLDNASQIDLVSNLDSDGSCDVQAINHITAADPMLGSLVNNGGGILTHIALTGSPVIDAGDDFMCLSLDQRRQIRPQDGDDNGTAECDIGAVEGVVEDHIYSDGFEQ